MTMTPMSSLAEGHGFAAGAPGWQPGQRSLGEHAAGHRPAAPPLHDGPQRQQRQAHHAEDRGPDPLPRPQQPPEEVHRLPPGHHRLGLLGTPVPHGKRFLIPPPKL